MLAFVLLTITAFLFFRQCMIITYKKWSLLSSFFLIFFLMQSLLFLKKGLAGFSWPPLLFCLSVLLPWALYDRYKLKKNTFGFSGLRFVLGCVFTLFCLLFLSSIILPHLHDQEAVLQVEMTAEEKEDIITWKHPSCALQRRSFIKRRCIISTIDGKVIFDDFILGDTINLRIKQLLTPTWLSALGFPSLWDTDVVSSDYLSAEEKKYAPADVYSIEMTHKNVFTRFLWSFWQTGFFSGTLPFPLGKSTISSAYIPLINEKGRASKGVYTVHVSSKEATIISKTEKSSEEKYPH